MNTFGSHTRCHVVYGSTNNIFVHKRLENEARLVSIYHSNDMLAMYQQLPLMYSTTCTTFVNAQVLQKIPIPALVAICYTINRMNSPILLLGWPWRHPLLRPPKH